MTAKWLALTARSNCPETSLKVRMIRPPSLDVSARYQRLGASVSATVELFVTGFRQAGRVIPDRILNRIPVVHTGSGIRVNHGDRLIAGRNRRAKF